jgi:hypothetical protein
MGLDHSPAIVTDGLVFYLDAANKRCYSGSGLTANELVGNIKGSLVNGVGFTSTNNGSFVFDATDDYMLYGTNSIWAVGNTATLEMWVLARLNNTNARLWCVANTQTSLDAYINSVGLLGFHGSASTVSTFPMDQWVHLTVVYDNGNFSVYYNGLIQSVNGKISGYNISVTGNLFIGQYAGGGNYYHKGNIANFKIYKNRALSQQEILQNYNSTKMRYGL